MNCHASFRILSAAMAMVCALFAVADKAGAGAALSSTPSAVVELFTSQGCSSCPAADALLGRLTKQPGIIAMSFSVDYWDYLGWRDTLASPNNSERQRSYARTRGDGRVYTPQMVVDGVTHVNGSDEEAVKNAVAAAEKRLAGVKVKVDMRGEGDTLVIDIGKAPEGSDQQAATVWLALAKKSEKVEITRGENRGKELVYNHPVRELTPIGMWQGEATTLRLPLKDLKTMGGDCLFALLQVEDGGAILGAAQFMP